jgi:hypothetical protein
MINIGINGVTVDDTISVKKLTKPKLIKFLFNLGQARNMIYLIHEIMVRLHYINNIFCISNVDLKY